MFGDLARAPFSVGPCHAKVPQRLSKGLANANARVE